MIRRILGAIWRWWTAHFVEIVVILTAITMLVGLGLIAISIIDVAGDVKAVHAKAEKAEQEAAQAKAVQQKLLTNSELNKQRWLLLEKHNPEIAVPEIVGPLTLPTPVPSAPEERPKLVIRERQPQPTPTPKVVIKQPKTKIRLVTPVPLIDRIFGATPRPTRKR